MPCALGDVQSLQSRAKPHALPKNTYHYRCSSLKRDPRQSNDLAKHAEEQECIMSMPVCPSRSSKAPTLAYVWTDTIGALCRSMTIKCSPFESSNSVTLSSSLFSSSMAPVY